MNTEEFLNYYDQTVTNFNATVSLADNVLLRLLKSNKHHITGLIEQDETGYTLHKALRQQDITSCGHTDMAIWFLIAEAQLFWAVLKYKKALTVFDLD
jgi:hypothetical protein